MEADLHLNKDVNDMLSFALGALLGYFGIKAAGSVADRTVSQVGLPGVVASIIKVVLAIALSVFVWIVALIIPINHSFRWGVYAASVYKVVVIVSKLFKTVSG